jgi:hypothetical protein
MQHKWAKYITWATISPLERCRLKPICPCGAENTAHGTSSLAGNAERIPLVIAHQDRFNGFPILQSKQVILTVCPSDEFERGCQGQ